MEEKELVRAAKSGSREAFGEIYERYQAQLLRYLIGMLRDPQLAEDLCQETFASAYRTVQALEHEEQLLPWLYRIATNKAISSLRRRRLIRWIPFDVDMHDRGDHARPDERVVERDAISRALDCVPHDLAACLVGYAEGLSYQELALIFNCSLGAIKQRLYRARLSFRKAYADELTSPTARPHSQTIPAVLEVRRA
ncbi:MAG: RNA polymerase sigma factor [Chloroflexi bacterium]|nr:RNA polymerase sigma factor [Chloroflexota bacterium]